MPTTEQTVAIIKPDAVRRKLTGQIITRIEAEGFEIDAIARLACQPEHMGLDWPCALFYERQHCGRDYFFRLVEFMASGPVYALLLSAPDAVAKWREVIGPWQERERLDRLWTIRGGLMLPGDTMANLVHGSDSLESFDYERSILADVLLEG